jgi:hypothetical protein
VFEFRVTKYDPVHRESRVGYTRSDWSSISDIGRIFNDVVLTEVEYQQVEEAYVAVAMAFLNEAGVSSLMVKGLEHDQLVPLSFEEGSMLELNQIREVIRRLLREEFWCRLEGSGSFIHVGYDFYMYVGVLSPCPKAMAFTQQLGLFSEPFRSPYRERVE